jgi:hypothetical protein
MIFHAEFTGIVLGRFAGHVHFAGATDEGLFTQISSISQAGQTSFSVMTIGNSPDRQNVRTTAGRSWEQFIPAVRLDRDVYSWTGGAGAPNDASMWKVVPVSSPEQHPVILQPTDHPDHPNHGDEATSLIGAIAISFTLCIACAFSAFRRQDRSPMLLTGGGKTEGEGSIYENAIGTSGHMSCTTEHNPP